MPNDRPQPLINPGEGSLDASKCPWWAPELPVGMFQLGPEDCSQRLAETWTRATTRLFHVIPSTPTSLKPIPRQATINVRYHCYTLVFLPVILHGSTLIKAIFWSTGATVFFFQWQVMVRCLHPWPSKLWAERMKWSYGPHFKSIRSHTTCWSQRQVTLKMFQPWRVWTLTIKLGQLLVHQADNDCFQQRSS